MAHPFRLLPLLLVACFPGGGTVAERPEPTPAVDRTQGPTVFAGQRAADRTADPLRAAADGHHSVTVDTPYLDGESDLPSPIVLVPFDLQSVQAEVEHNVGHLQRCYDARVQQAPDLRGTILIHAHITPEGKVDGQCITEDTVGDEALVQCVNEVIAMGRYAGGNTETVDVTVPFVFSPRG